jgi:Chaperone of endosialidase
LAIADNSNVAFYNLLSETFAGATRNNTIAGFGADGTNNNRFIIRGYSGTNAANGRDLLIANPGGATGINAEPLFTFWVDAGGDITPLSKSIAITGRQPFGFPGVQVNNSSSSAIGTQANGSLAGSGIMAEGFRAQMSSFVPNSGPGGIGVNLQTVRSPYSGIDASFALDFNSTQNVNSISEYAELTWQDIDLIPSQADLTVCNIPQAEAWNKFFISFRNDNPTNPFGQANKLPVMTFQGNGRVGIGKLQPTSGTCAKPILLDVNGIMVANNLLVGSDRRFKQDIKPVTNAMELLRKVQGTTYQFKNTQDGNRTVLTCCPS